ncbi:MAG: deoxyribose-phosphate aldolase, partial [bacterium]
MQELKDIKNIAGYIDHTCLKPNAVKDDIKRLCREAKEYHFYSVCINPIYVQFAADLIRNTQVKICTVVGFPTGCHPSEVKVFETEKVLDAGAQEIDMVIQVGSLIEGDNQAVFDDILSVTEICHKRDAITKVIIETAFLS